MILQCLYTVDHTNKTIPRSNIEPARAKAMDESYDDQPHVEDIEILDEDIPAPLEQSSEPSKLNAQLILLIAVVAILIGKTPSHHHPLLFSSSLAATLFHHI